MTELNTIWLDPEASTSKFLASVCMHRLSKMLNRRFYEAVVEGFLDLQDADSLQADLVVYDKQDQYHSRVVIHFTGHALSEAEFSDIALQLRCYNISEGYIYNFTSCEWIKIGLNGSAAFTDQSEVLGIALDTVLMEGLSAYRA